MPLTTSQQHCLQAMGVTVYHDKRQPQAAACDEAAIAPDNTDNHRVQDATASPAIQLPDTLQAYLFTLKNQQQALVLADWDINQVAALTTLRDAICKALGQIDAMPIELTQDHLAMANLFCYGANAYAFLCRHAGATAQHTHSFADMLANPGLKREAWAVMQQLLAV